VHRRLGTTILTLFPTASSLDRESYDFGRSKWHLLETLKVPSTYRGMRIVYSYDDGFHDDFNVSEELNIEYYD
jgi:hypothetical protein